MFTAKRLKDQIMPANRISGEKYQNGYPKYYNFKIMNYWFEATSEAPQNRHNGYKHNAVITLMECVSH